MLEKNRNIFSLDLNVPSEWLTVILLGREFQVGAGAEQRNARLANLNKSLLTVLLLSARGRPGPLLNDPGTFFSSTVTL